LWLTLCATGVRGVPLSDARQALSAVYASALKSVPAASAEPVWRAFADALVASGAAADSITALLVVRSCVCLIRFSI
jgi:hypothetical protein